VDAPIPLPNVSSKILAKVIEYCKYHVGGKKSETSEDEQKTFDSEFVKVDQATLFELILVRPRPVSSPRSRSRSRLDEGRKNALLSSLVVTGAWFLLISSLRPRRRLTLRRRTT